MISYDMCIFVVGICMFLSCWLGIAMGRWSTCMRIIDFILYNCDDKVDFGDIIEALKYARGERTLLNK